MRNSLKGALLAAQSAHAGQKAKSVLLTEERIRKSVFRKIVAMLAGGQFADRVDKLHPLRIDRLTDAERAWVLQNWAFLREYASKCTLARHANVRERVPVFDLSKFEPVDPDRQVVSFHPTANWRKKERYRSKTVGDFRDRQTFSGRQFMSEDEVEEAYQAYISRG